MFGSRGGGRFRGAGEDTVLPDKSMHRNLSTTAYPTQSSTQFSLPHAHTVTPPHTHNRLCEYLPAHVAVESPALLSLPHQGLD